jgi:hypothetical protein
MGSALASNGLEYLLRPPQSCLRSIICCLAPCSLLRSFTCIVTASFRALSVFGVFLLDMLLKGRPHF